MLLSELLLFAKPHQLNKRALDLDDLIKETLDNLQDAPPNEQREISYKPQHPLIVVADKDKLKQVMINLLTNARQATRPNEIITLNLTQINYRLVSEQLKHYAEDFSSSHNIVLQKVSIT